MWRHRAQVDIAGYGMEYVGRNKVIVRAGSGRR